MKLNLIANNDNEKRVLAYLEENASEVLAEKINAGNKTLKGFFGYASGEAKKLAINGCACVEDKAVFGWAVHYFEEDEIKEPKTTAETSQPIEPKKVIEKIAVPKKTQAETPKKAKAADKPGKKAKAKDDSQMSIFDMRGFKRCGI